MNKDSNVLEFRMKDDAANNYYYALAAACNVNYYYQLCDFSMISTDGNNFNILFLNLRYILLKAGILFIMRSLRGYLLIAPGLASMKNIKNIHMQLISDFTGRCKNLL